VYRQYVRFLDNIYAMQATSVAGAASSGEGGQMTLTETVALLMLIGYVIYLVVYISRKKK